uniref:Uncharacterized protein n=2 Tax=Micrurus TaxID=8634 RepID=A0A2D4P6G4_MICSU
MAQLMNRKRVNFVQFPDTQHFIPLPVLHRCIFFHTQEVRKLKRFQSCLLSVKKTSKNVYLASAYLHLIGNTFNSAKSIFETIFVLETWVCQTENKHLSCCYKGFYKMLGTASFNMYNSFFFSQQTIFLFNF